MLIKTIDDLAVAGKRVLLRVDFNAPMRGGRVTDRTRLHRTLATVRELTGKGARVILMSHLGRPKGRTNPEFSLRPIAEAFAEVAGVPVAFAADTVGAAARAMAASLNDGEIGMLENLRFQAGEETNDAGFAGQLAALGDVYVSDAFSCSHRAHASTEAVAKLLPAAAGRLMERELTALGEALDNPQHPVAAVVGGAKISTKMAVLGHLSNKVDLLIIGGGMANTFLYAGGVDVGKSLCEVDMADEARAIIKSAAASGCQIVLPVDAVVAWEFAEGAECQTVGLDRVPADAMILDVGAASVAGLVARLETCKTLVWNGPMGAFEIKPFDAGTNALAQAAARLTKQGRLLSVAGGGDTVAALANAGVSGDFSYISTAGGAFLEWLEGRQLPGVAVLQNTG